MLSNQDENTDMDRRPQSGKKWLSRFQKLVLPGLILQSVVIGGGYSTGREVVQYGARYGAVGWITVVVAVVGFSLVSALVFEVARVFRSYDYKTWIQQIIGKFWPIFEGLFLVMVIIGIAVVVSAGGNILEQTWGFPYLPAVLGITAAVAVIICHGSHTVERFKTIGSVFLYSGYAIFSWVVLSQKWGQVAAVFASHDSSYVPGAGSWAAFSSGVLYVGYNLAVFPTVLFCLHRQDSRKETMAAGLVAGLLMTVPFGLTYLSLMAFYPAEEVIGAPVPWLPMLQSLGSPFVVLLYGAVVGWTLVETTVGVIHAIVDRIERHLSPDRGTRLQRTSGLSQKHRALLAIAILAAAAALSRFGITALVARGYSLMAYGFIVIFAVPLLTVGVYRIVRATKKIKAQP